METKWVDQYLQAWSTHTDGKASTAEAMFEAASDDYLFEDVAIRHVEPPGRDNIPNHCTGASRIFPGAVFDIPNKVIGESNWAIEWEVSGIHAPTQKPFRLRAVSIGELAADGKVRSHRDYWDLAQLEAQLGKGVMGTSTEIEK